MAITIQQQPGLYSPLYNPMPFVVTSTNYAQTNFQYLFDIYVSGQTNYTRIAVPSDPDFTQGYIDVSRVLRNFVNMKGAEDILENDTGFIRCLNSFIAYEVKIGEQYGVASAVTNYPNLTATGTKYGYNGVLTTNEYTNYNGNNQGIEITGRAFTAIPTTGVSLPRSVPNDMWLHYMTGTSGSVYFLRITTYDSAGSTVGTYNIENSFQAVATYNMRRMRIGCGIAQLNSSTLYSGIQPVIGPTVVRYKLELLNWSGSQQCPAIFIDVDDRCLPVGRSAYHLSWKNKDGGYDSFAFPLVSRLTKDVSRETFDRKLGLLGNHTWSYQRTDAGVTVIDTMITPRWELTSDWISEDVSTYLMQLVESPVVFFDDGVYKYPCRVVTPTQSEMKTIDNSVLFNFTVTIELSNKEWRQHS
jgi:hypothetical protein